MEMLALGMTRNFEPVMSTAAELQDRVEKHSGFAPLSRMRGFRGSRWPEWCTLLSFIAVVAFAIPYHEPWADEAQAWQLARSLPLTTLFSRFIRYEGSPGLWHFLLWVLIRVHVSYTGLHWICGVIAAVGVSLLIFKAPFPRYIRLSLPFTYFLLFQYAVIARNYVLAPLMMFLLAIAWKKSPWGVTLLLGLLANVCLHTTVLSGGLAIVYLVEQIRRPEADRAATRRTLLLCALLLAAFYAFALWTAWPPHDLRLARVRGDSRNVFVTGMLSLCWGMCQPAIVSVPFWFAIALWFTARRKLLYLLPVLLFAIFSGAVYANWWHTGLLVPCLICILWIVWPASHTGPGEFGKTLRIALLVMIAGQIAWSTYAIHYDHYNAYSPDKAAAEFLKPFVKRGDSIAATYVDDYNWRGHGFLSTGILPYFDRNIYVNTPYPFWWWSEKDRSQEEFLALLPSHPRIVLVDIGALHPMPEPNRNYPEFIALLKDGYVYRKTFCGSQPQGLKLGTMLCHVIFEYPGAARPAGK